MMELLQTILFLPIFAILLLLLIGDKDLALIRVVSLAISVILFLISVVIFVTYDQSTFVDLFQFSFSIKLLNYIDFSYGLDGISISFILLTAFLIPICILCSWESIKFRVKEFMILLFVIEFCLFNAFATLDLLVFYIFFEAILIPMFIMIGVWGSRERKIQAAYKFFIYTFFGSVFMLLGILYIQSTVGSTDYRVLLGLTFLPYIEILLWLSFFASFIVKIPMLPVHIWLPEAHVEAPTAGSVLLAGILLKLGTYGLIRFSLPLFPFATRYFTPLVLVISVVSIVYSSLTTLRQIDLKKIIAYTSVAHMNLVTIGIFSASLNGLEGAIYLMLSHGLVSSGLFLSIGVIYDRYHTRIVRYYGGLINLMPLYGIVFLILSLSNMGLPGTSAFVGEFLILVGSFTINTFSAFLASLGVVLSAAYSLWLYNRVMFGPIKDNIKVYSDMNQRETFYMSIICFLVILFGFYPNGILNILHISCSAILHR